MAELPKLKPCNRCNKVPEWFLGWNDIEKDTAVLCLTCDCIESERIRVTIPSVAFYFSEDGQDVGEHYVRQMIKMMEKKWDEFQKGGTDGTGDASVGE